MHRAGLQAKHFPILLVSNRHECIFASGEQLWPPPSAENSIVACRDNSGKTKTAFARPLARYRKLCAIVWPLRNVAHANLACSVHNRVNAECSQGCEHGKVNNVRHAQTGTV